MNPRAVVAVTCFGLSALSFGLQACSDDGVATGDAADVGYPLAIGDPAATLDFDPAEYEPMTEPPVRTRAAKRPKLDRGLVRYDVLTKQFTRPEARAAQIAPSPADAPGAALDRREASRGLMVKRDLERFGLRADDPEALDKLDTLENLHEQTRIKDLGAIVTRPDTTTFEGRTTVKLFLTYSTGAKSYCSGKLVGRRAAVTAGHCLSLSPLRGGRGSVVSGRVVPGSVNTYMPYGDANIVDWRADQDWIDEEDNDEDWGMVWLDRDIGDVTGFFTIWAASDSSLEDLHMDFYGYPQTNEGRYQANSTGHVICTDTWSVFHNASSIGGMSGSGVHAQSGSRRHQVFGVIRGADYNGWCSTSKMNSATRFDSARRTEILNQLEDRPARAPGSMAGWTPLGGQGTVPLTAVSMAPDRNDIFVRGTGNQAHHKWQFGNAFGPADGGWEFLDGLLIGKVAVASRAANVLDLFVRYAANPGQICTKSWVVNEWRPSLTTWDCFTDAAIASSPTVVSTAPDRLHVFGRQSNGSVIEKPWTGQAGWLASVNLGGRTNEDVAVESRGPFLWDAFIRNVDTGQLCTKSRNGGSVWPAGTDWSCFAGTSVLSEPTVVSSGPNNLDVFYVGSDQITRHMKWRGATWEGPFSLGGLTNGAVTAVSRSSNQVDIFVVGLDGAIYTKANNGSGWWPSQEGWSGLGGDMIDVTAVSWGPSRIDLFARDRALQPHNRYWNGSTWSQ